MNPGRLAFSAAMAAALVLPACESPAKVTVMQSATAAVTPGATYAWAPIGSQEQQNGDPRIDNDIIRQRIHTAIDTGLTAKGFQLSQDPSSSQLLVTYHVGLKSGADYRVDTYGASPAAVCGWRGCISGYGWGMYGAPTNVDVRQINYVDGTLILDLKDRASGQLAWRATSQKRVDENDAAQDKLNAIVVDMVKSLPG